MKTIKIGTRGSNLALVQSEWVKAELEKNFPDILFELVIIKTKGDKILDSPLSKIGDKGLFTKEIEEQLIDNSIDLAVHSMKDLPTLLPEGLTVGAITKRVNPSDILISKSIKKLNQFGRGDTIATSSLRRKAQLLAMLPEVTIVDIRGNLNTRLDKLKSNDNIDAIILAYAGISRLGMNEKISEIIPSETIIPAVGQASLAIEIRENDSDTAKIISVLNDTNSQMAIECERAFLLTLEGGCQVPVAGYASVKDNNIILHGMVAAVDGSLIYKESMEGDVSSHIALGTEVANRLLARGAKKILDEIYNNQ